MSKTTQLRNIHPGEVLREEFQRKSGVLQYCNEYQLEELEEPSSNSMGIYLT